MPTTITSICPQQTTGVSGISVDGSSFLTGNGTQTGVGCCTAIRLVVTSGHSLEAAFVSMQLQLLQTWVIRLPVVATEEAMDGCFRGVQATTYVALDSVRCSSDDNDE
jgi:hypothetical protein